MKDRVQVADLAQAQLRPDARPVDIYYRPQAEAVQQRGDPMLVQLAEGLAKFQPKIAEFAGKLADKENKQDQAEGNQAYRDALMNDADLNKKAFKDLVDQGVIPAGASPWFQKGWREQQLRALGEEYGRDVTLAWNQNGDLKNSDDPGKFNQFLAQQSQEFREKIKASGGEFRPTELTEVLDPPIDHYNHNVGQEHVRFRVGEIEKDVDTNSRIAVGRWTTRTDLPVEERAAGIQSEIDGMFSKGLSGSKSRQIMAEAVMDAASTSKDPSMLSLLDHLKTGNTALSQDPIIRTKMEQAQQHIEERQRNDQRWSWAVEDRKYHEEVTKPRAEQSWKWTMQQHSWASDQHDRAEQERTLHSALGDEIRADPAQDLRKSPQFEKLTRLDPMKAQAMLHFQQVYLGAGEEVKSDDPNSVFQITKDLYTGQEDPTQLRVRAMNAFTHGLMTRGRFEKINEEILQYQEGRKDPILGSPEMHQLQDGVYKGIVKDLGGQFGEPAVRASMSAAEFYGWARQWSKDHPGAGAAVSDFRKEAEQKAADLILAGKGQNLIERQDLFPNRGDQPFQHQDAKAITPKPSPQVPAQGTISVGTGRRVIPVQDAIRMMIQNPSKEFQAAFERDYGLKAADFLLVGQPQQAPSR
jgi:hypothetical protein